MSDTTYPPSVKFATNAHVDATKYKEMYAASIEDPVMFWGEHGKRIDWIKPAKPRFSLLFRPCGSRRNPDRRR